MVLSLVPPLNGEGAPEGEWRMKGFPTVVTTQGRAFLQRGREFCFKTGLNMM